MKRLVTSTVLVLAMLSSLVGCGKKEPTPASETTIDVLSWQEVKADSPLDKMKQAFEAKNPGIKVNYIVGPVEGYHDKLLARIAGGEVPDVAMIGQDQYPAFAEKNAVVKLDEHITSEYKSDLYPAVLQTITYKGSIYAVPRDVTAVAMYYNKKLFDEAKVSYPKEGWTWDDFLTTAKALTKTDASGKPVQWGFHFATNPAGFYEWILQNGGAYVSPDGTKSMLGNKETMESIQFLVDLRNKYKVAPSAAQAKELGSLAQSAFTSGKVAMYAAGVSRAVTFTQAKLDYDVAPLPKGKKAASWTYTNMWVIPKGAKHEEAAWNFLEFIGGKEGQALVQELGIGQSALQSVDSAKFLTPPPASKKYFLDAFKDAQPYPTFVGSKEFFALMQKELDLVWNGQRPLEEAIAAIEKQAPSILGGK